MALDRKHEGVQQVQGGLGLVLLVLAVLVARVICTLVAVVVQLILGVAGNLGLSEVSDGGCRGTPLPPGSVCRLPMPASCPW